jgi:hypothetical protein
MTLETAVDGECLWTDSASEWSFTGVYALMNGPLRHTWEPFLTDIALPWFLILMNTLDVHVELADLDIMLWAQWTWEWPIALMLTFVNFERVLPRERLAARTATVFLGASMRRQVLQ